MYGECVSRWRFVDLAGTERIEKQGVILREQTRETKAINRAVFHLNKFVQELVDKGDQCLYFRNSLLTKLLKESFMADRNVVFVICLQSNLCSLERSLQSI